MTQILIIYIHKGALPFDVNFILSATNPQAAWFLIVHKLFHRILWFRCFFRENLYVYYVVHKETKGRYVQSLCSVIDRKDLLDLVEDETWELKKKGWKRVYYSTLFNERKHVLYVYQLLTVMVSWGIFQAENCYPVFNMYTLSRL